jgi:hypothetical protein
MISRIKKIVIPSAGFPLPPDTDLSWGVDLNQTGDTMGQRNVILIGVSFTSVLLVFGEHHIHTPVQQILRVPGAP